MDTLNPTGGKDAGHRGSLGEIQFASKSMKQCSLISKSLLINQGMSL